jgi:hypothetical protein
MHPHRDLEILMLPRECRIDQRDHLGGRAFVSPGASRYLHLMGDALVQRHATIPRTFHANEAAEALCFELPPLTP